MKDPIPDLADRLALLASRYSVVFDTAATSEPHVHRAVAEALIRYLREGWTEDVVVKVRGAVDPGELSGSSAFWGTPLGRLLFEAGGFFGETLTQTTAAGLLGCSRQWVHAMVAEGKLAMAPERGVYAAEVRAVLLARAERVAAIRSRAERIGLDGEVK